MISQTMSTSAERSALVALRTKTSAFGSNFPRLVPLFNVCVRCGLLLQRKYNVGLDIDSRNISVFVRFGASSEGNPLTSTEFYLSLRMIPMGVSLFSLPIDT